MITGLIQKYRNILLFGFAGGIGYVADLAVTLLLEPFTNQYISRIPAFLFAATVTWIINRSITFKHRKSQKSLFAEWLHYISLMLLGLFFNYIAYAIAVTYLPSGVLSIVVAVAVGSIVGMVVNYFTSSKLLYKK